MSIWLKRSLFGLCLLAVVGAVGRPAVATTAAILTVTTTADDTITDGQCSLREAIINANNNTATHPDCLAGSGADTIVFAAGLAGGTITLTAGLPALADAVTLDGSALSPLLTISGNDVARQLVINTGISATVSALVLTQGYSGSLGGAIYNNGGNLIVDGVTFYDNAAGFLGVTGLGGGLYNAAGGTATVLNTTFSTNLGAQGGGGIYNAGDLVVSDSLFEYNITYCSTCDSFGVSSGGGAGIQNAFGTALVERTTFRYNTGTSVSYGAAIRNDLYSSFTLRESVVHDNSISTEFGGGIYNRGGMEITNSTISSNINGGGGIFSGFGGGIYNDFLATHLVLNNVTLANNQAGHGGGVASDGPMTVRNSIIADNITTDTGPDCEGTLTSAGYNLIEDTTNCSLTGNLTGVIVGLPADLGPLQANGGPTVTHALLSTSIAIDAGNPAGCVDGSSALLTTDQRGYLRPQGPACDLGAYEANALLVMIDLQIAKYAQTRYVQNNNEVVYTLDYDNSGSVLATGVRITDVVPITLTNVVYTSSGADISLIPGTQYAWEVEDLSPGEGGTITIMGRVSPAVYYPSLMRNEVHIASREPDSLPEDNSAEWDIHLCAPQRYVFTQADDGVGSLRRAIRLACPGGLVWLGPGLAGDTISLTSGEIVIDKKLKLNGFLAPGAFIHANDTSRIFTVKSHADLTMRWLTLSHGAADYGGAIRNQGRLGMAHVTLQANSAAYGGAVYNDPGGQVFVLSSQALSNTADEGGAFYNSHSAVFTMEDVVISDNSATALGGGALNWGEMSITDSTISHNVVTNSLGDFAGGGIGNNGGVLVVTRTLVQENHSGAGSGGGIDSYGLNAPDETFVTIEDSQIISNTATYGGGLGIFGGNMTVRRTLIRGNVSGGGGGLSNLDGILTVENSTVSANTAGSGGGIVSSFGFIIGATRLYNVTVADNVASDVTGVGGGVWGTLTLYNSLVAGNRVETNPTHWAADCNGTISSGGYNLVGSGTGCPTTGAGDQTVAPADVFTTVIGPLTPDVGPT